MRMRARINIVFYSTIKNASKFATQEILCGALDQQVASLPNIARGGFWVKIIEFDIIFLHVINKCESYYNLHKNHLVINA